MPSCFDISPIAAKPPRTHGGGVATAPSGRFWGTTVNAILARAASAAILAVGLAVQAAGPASAEGNLASRPTRLAPLVLGADLSFSVKQYRLETGKYYAWTIRSDGGEEFQVKAPDLFRNSWIDQVVIDDLEVKPAGGLNSVEFDDAGEITIWFVPIRPGNYDYYVEGHRTRGMEGVFVTR